MRILQKNRRLVSGLVVVASLFLIRQPALVDDDSDILFQIPALVVGHHSGSQETPSLYGEVHAGQYHLGPVDFAETEWHNACAPPADIGVSCEKARAWKENTSPE
jgi:hypothetical protein